MKGKYSVLLSQIDYCRESYETHTHTNILIYGHMKLNSKENDGASYYIFYFLIRKTLGGNFAKNFEFDLLKVI